MIKFFARGRCAQALADNPVTTGSVGIPVRFFFSPDWDSLQKIAVFRAGETAVDVALTGDAATVPADVLTTAGLPLMIGVYGAAADGTVVIPTVWAKVDTIKAGAIPSGVDPSEPAPSWVAQVQQMAADAYEMANDVKEAAENGEFDGEPGENGVGVPAGGLPGMVLLKHSLTDYDTEWGLPPFEVDSYTFRAVYDEATDSYTVTTGTGTTIAELWAVQENGKTLVFIVNINSGETILTSADVTFNTDGMDALACIVRFGGDSEAGFYQLSNSGSGWELRFVMFPASSGGGAVESVNGQIGAVVLTAQDVDALPDTTEIPTKTSDLQNDSGFITSAAVPTAVSELTNDSGFQTAAQVEAAIDSHLSAVYKAAGSVASIAALPAPSAAYLGYVYNVEAAFTTTADFVEGAGIEYPAGTDVAIVATQSGGSTVYKFDALSGFVDLSGYIAKPASASAGQFLVYDGTAWTAQTLATWQGGSF